MEIPPQYTITNEMLSLITQIEANRVSLQSATMPEALLVNLRRESLLKSSVYSAQIEGNSLTIEDLAEHEEESEKRYEQIEIENIIRALSLMREEGIPDIIDLAYILNLHRLVLNNLVHSSLTGVLRTEPSAIFDQNGNVVYMTPPPSQINPLLSDLLRLINQSTQMFPLIKACLVHLSFEKIHPFIDGNGRVGRLLIQAILAKHGYHFNWLISIEEGLQERKQTYYSLLERADATAFTEFMLSVILDASNELKRKVTTTASPKPQDFLLPRRKEILQIIQDQGIVSFDQIHRRFLKIPDRTLRYDLQQLEKGGFIQKIGTTRGAVYQVKK